MVIQPDEQPQEHRLVELVRELHGCHQAVPQRHEQFRHHEEQPVRLRRDRLLLVHRQPQRPQPQQRIRLVGRVQHRAPYWVFRPVESLSTLEQPEEAVELLAKLRLPELRQPQVLAAHFQALEPCKPPAQQQAPLRPLLEEVAEKP